MVTAIPTLFVGLFAGVSSWIASTASTYPELLKASDILRGILVLMIPFGFQLFGNETGMVIMYVLLFFAATESRSSSTRPRRAAPRGGVRGGAGLRELVPVHRLVRLHRRRLRPRRPPRRNALHLPFFIDSLTFLISPVPASSPLRSPMADPRKSRHGRGSADNLEPGFRILFHTPILRSLFLIRASVLSSSGLSNALLLPCRSAPCTPTSSNTACRKGVTSVGFVVGKLSWPTPGRLPKAQWIVRWARPLRASCGVANASSKSITLGDPARHRHRVPELPDLLRPLRGGPAARPARDARPRGQRLSASRDVLFLVGMAAAALADIFQVRHLIIIASLLLVAAGIVAQLAPGIGIASLRAARARLAASGCRRSPASRSDRPRSPISTCSSASCRRSPGCPKRSARAFVTRCRRFAKSRPARASSSTATPRRRRTSSSMAGRRRASRDEGGYRGLSTMGAGDFFGEIAALTGSPRTADVVAEQRHDAARGARRWRCARRWPCPRSRSSSSRR